MSVDPGRSGPSAGDRALWAAGALLFVAVLVVSAVSLEDVARRVAIAAAVGGGLIALLVAGAARLAWTRIRGRGRVVSPSLLMVAAAISLLGLAVGNLAQSANDPRAEASDTQQCQAANEAPLPPAPDDLTYQSLTPEQQVRIEKEAGLVTETGTIADSRQVFFGDRPLGTVTAIPGFVDEAQREDFMRELRDLLARVDASPRSIQLGGRPALVASLPQREVDDRVFTTSGCHAILLSGVEESHVLYVAEALFGNSSERG